MNKFVRIIIVALLSTIFIMNTSAEGGFIPYDTYEYNEFGEPVETPAGYIPAQTIDAAKLGLTKPFDSISDLCYVNGTLYILDSGNGRIVELDEELNLVAEYSEFVIADGAGLECRDAFPDGKVTFVGAEGFTVTPDGSLYVAVR